MKLAIVGTRKPNINYTEWEKLLLEKINLDKVELIISGGAKGIDTYAKLFAGRHHIPLMEFLPEYDKYGIKAPLVRNRQIIKEANFVIAFPMGDSRGTFHAIMEAERMKRDVYIVRLNS